MVFLGGLIIGLFIGCIAGFFMAALVSVNGHTNLDDDEQAKYCSNIGEKKVSDKNEF